MSQKSECTVRWEFSRAKSVKCGRSGAQFLSRTTATRSRCASSILLSSSSALMTPPRPGLLSSSTSPLLILVGGRAQERNSEDGVGVQEDVLSDRDGCQRPMLPCFHLVLAHLARNLGLASMQRCTAVRWRADGASSARQLLLAWGSEPKTTLPTLFVCVSGPKHEEHSGDRAAGERGGKDPGASRRVGGRKGSWD